MSFQLLSSKLTSSLSSYPPRLALAMQLPWCALQCLRQEGPLCCDLDRVPESEASQLPGHTEHLSVGVDILCTHPLSMTLQGSVEGQGGLEVPYWRVEPGGPLHWFCKYLSRHALCFGTRWGTRMRSAVK